MTPSAARQASVQDAAFLTLMTVLTSGVNFITTFLLARILGPEGYGQWQTLVTLMTYVLLCDLGVSVGITRDVPVLLGRGDEPGYRRAAGTVFVWNLALAALVCAALAAGGVFTAKAEHFRAGLPLLGLFMLMYAFSGYHHMLLYAHQGLRLWSAATFMRGFFRLLAAVTLHRGGPAAILAGWILAEAPMMWLIRRMAPQVRLHAEFDRRLAKRLLWLGFPNFLLTLAQWQGRMGDRALVALFLDDGAMGYYSLASMVVAFLATIAVQVSQTMHPRIMRKYGETGDVRALKEYILEPCRAVSRVFPYLAGCTVALFPWLVYGWLPSYGPSVPVFGILALSSFFVAVPQTQGTLLVALEHTWFNLWIWCAVIATGVLTSYALLSAGQGIRGIALATAASWVVSFALHFAATLHYHVGRAEGLRYIGGLLAPFAYGLAALAAARWLGSLGAPSPGTRAVLELIIFTAAYAPVLWKVNRTYGVWPAVRGYLGSWKVRLAAS